ncbi:hypothetical protein E3U43_016713 [Larimichthys crocea]|uniref:Uncharacterized protein n=1 Tax=Larimichthys crocea TaxID=215358 RepID=A0ACD3QJD6_LARCR|nr:hypothetical protein E3U43_016713 [Larimichthys crocea]
MGRKEVRASSVLLPVSGEQCEEVSRNVQFALLRTRSVPVWTVHLPPTWGQPGARQKLRVRRPPV